MFGPNFPPPIVFSPNSHVKSIKITGLGPTLGVIFTNANKAIVHLVLLS